MARTRLASVNKVARRGYSFVSVLRSLSRGVKFAFFVYECASAVLRILIFNVTKEKNNIVKISVPDCKSKPQNIKKISIIYG